MASQVKDGEIDKCPAIEREKAWIMMST